MKKKKFLFIFLGALFIVIAIIFLFFPARQSKQKKTTDFFNTSPSPLIKEPSVLTVAAVEPIETEVDEPIENSQEFIKKELLPDGYSLYFLDSGEPDRPNLILVRGGEAEFQRAITSSDRTVPLSEYTPRYGIPEKIIKGSVFFGADKDIYVFASLGASIVVDTKTNRVIEESFFIPTTTDNYLSRYGKYL